MALDPSVAALLEQMPSLDPTFTVEEMRSQSAAQALLGGGNQQVTTVDRTIPGPAGEIPVRVYTPPAGSPPRGLVVFYHGGGLGDLRARHP
jgi:acetyl esterase